MTETVGIICSGDIDDTLLNPVMRITNNALTESGSPFNYVLRPLLPKCSHIPAVSYDARIGRYNIEPFFSLARTILGQAQAKKDDICLKKAIVMTNVPLFSYCSNSNVIGEADFNGSYAVFSIHGMDDDNKEIYNSRIVKEILFQLGLLNGLRHCSVEGCVMQQCKEVHDLDSKSFDYCHECKAKVAKLPKKPKYRQYNGTLEV